MRKSEEANTNNNIIMIVEDVKDESDHVEDSKLNLIISNRSEYFDLLFELLNLGITEITNAAWNLLIQIPVNLVSNTSKVYANVLVVTIYPYCSLMYMKYFSKHSYIISVIYLKSSFNKVSKKSISRQSSLKILSLAAIIEELLFLEFEGSANDETKIYVHQLKNWSLSRS